MCSVDGHLIHIDNRRYLEANDVVISAGTYDAMRYLKNKGQTSIAISINRCSEAVIGLIDKACDEASSLINVFIFEMGIKVYMLTGDNARQQPL